MYRNGMNEQTSIRGGEEGIIHDDDIIQKNTMFICSSTIFACLSRVGNLFCNVFFCLLKRQHKVKPPRALTTPQTLFKRKKNPLTRIKKYFCDVYVFSIFLSFFFFYSFRKDRKISFGGEKKRKRKQ